MTIPLWNMLVKPTALIIREWDDTLETVLAQLDGPDHALILYPNDVCHRVPLDYLESITVEVRGCTT